MNKYILQKDHIYIWYICPRRKEGSEKGCGHIAPITVKRIAADKDVEPIFDSRLVGEVKASDKLIMIIQDNAETFNTWLEQRREKFKDKRVEITVRVIGEEERE